ncbi:universal stress protein [Burkholderia sp. AW33-5]
MYERILAPIDGSTTSQHAFEVARVIAREDRAELIPLYVVEVPLVAYETAGGDPKFVYAALLKEGERLTNAALATMRRDGICGMPRVVEIDARGDSIPGRILEEARAARCDLVVMGTHGRSGVKRLMLGSVAEHFVRISCCPVLLVPDTALHCRHPDGSRTSNPTTPS